MSDNTVKCAVTDRNRSMIACSSGTPEATRKAQETLVSAYANDDPMRLWKSRYCEFRSAGKAEVVVGYRKMTPEENRACRVQQIREKYFTEPGQNMCGITVIVEQQDQYQVSCDGKK